MLAYARACARAASVCQVRFGANIEKQCLSLVSFLLMAFPFSLQKEAFPFSFTTLYFPLNCYPAFVVLIGDTCMTGQAFQTWWWAWIGQIPLSSQLFAKCAFFVGNKNTPARQATCRHDSLLPAGATISCGDKKCAHGGKDLLVGLRKKAGGLFGCVVVDILSV